MNAEDVIGSEAILLGDAEYQRRLRDIAAAYEAEQIQAWREAQAEPIT
jgi:hypothetical protein